MQPSCHITVGRLVIINVDVWGWHYQVHAQTLQGHLTNTKQTHVNTDAARVLASSPKDVLKITVFRKAASDCSSLTKDGREFQARAAAAGNAQSPKSGQLETQQLCSQRNAVCFLDSS